MIRTTETCRLIVALAVLATAGAGSVVAAPTPAPKDVQPFLQKYCIECHDAETKKGDLDLSALKFDPTDRKSFAEWVAVYDRVSAGEMPPKKKQAHLDRSEVGAFTKALSHPLAAVDDGRTVKEGRSTQRRLNRYEYENMVRDLLAAPWLQVRDALPEDGESNRFNKVGDALDVSHVQMARYLSVADYALRQVTVSQVERPATRTVRYYTREQKSFTSKMKFSVFNTRPERATFPVLGSSPQPDVRSFNAPMTAGATDPKTREQEAVGVVASTYEPLEIKFNSFEAPASGHYRLRFKAYSVWVGPGKGEKWDIPDLDTVSEGRRSEPVTIYGETQPRLLRRLGAFDAQPKPGVAELDVYLLAGETIRPDAARLFRSRPPSWHNPLAEKDGCPGLAIAWMEVEGPIYDQWPTAGHRVLFGDLPLKKADGGNASEGGAGVEVVTTDAKADSNRLLRSFMNRAYRRPVTDAEAGRFLSVIDKARASGSSFADAMITGYTAVLCSPGFVEVEERPGRLDDAALASRLSLFLWNSGPDDELDRVAAKNELRRPDVLRAQTTRMLADPKSRRFVDAFLDYWLDLRKITATAPDSTLYPDYYLDDLLTESAGEETQSFFKELIRDDLPARNIAASDFAMLNERLAVLYGIPGVEGVALRRVKLPTDSPRGGLMTQASVLKVTANGTTTSPVLRGAWVMERILGQPVPPPPPSVPAVEPDTRGATTIREQLAAHRTLASCSACHAKMDPAGFALENFDVMGGWRDTYRALGDGKPTGTGIGKNGQRYTFHAGQPIDASGELPDGRKFRDVRELKALLVADERQLARNLARQLVVYATGAPIRFGDRAKVEAILDRAAPSHYGVRSLIGAIVESELFENK